MARIEEKKCLENVVGDSVGGMPLGRPMLKQEDIIKKGSSGNRMEGRGLDSCGSGQGEVLGCCEHDSETAVSVKRAGGLRALVASRGNIGFSRRLLLQGLTYLSVKLLYFNVL